MSQKVESAFKRVKADMLHLAKRIEELEKNNKEMYKAFRTLEKNQQLNTNNIAANTTSNQSKLYIGNQRSMKLHVSDCPYAKKTNTENRVLFDSINDALKQKYKRCTCL